MRFTNEGLGRLRRSCPSLRSRLSPIGELYVLPSRIEPEAAARVGRHLHGHGPLHCLIVRRAYGQHIVPAHVGHHELVASTQEPSPNFTPPELRFCAGADWPLYHTVSGNSFCTSAALRTVSLCAMA